MKKGLIGLIIVMALLFLTSCNSNNDRTTIKDGTYVMVQTGTEGILSPRVTISNEKISFSYDSLSSYLPIGVYTIEKDVLTMITNDGRYKYVFQIDGDKLIFQKNKSSKVNLIDESIGIKIVDNAEFKRIEN